MLLMKPLVKLVAWRGHLFWDCDKVKETWELSSIPFNRNCQLYREFVDLIWHFIFVQHIGLNLLELTLIIAWCIWFNWNKAKMGTPRQFAHEIISKACYLLEEFQLTHLRPPRYKDALQKTLAIVAFFQLHLQKNVAIGSLQLCFL